MSANYWKTLYGSHRHTTHYCANKHRSIHSGDCLVVTAEEFDTLEPCAECCTAEEHEAWSVAAAAKQSTMCPNRGVTHPHRIYSTCRDCGKEGKVNKSTGSLRSHKRS